MVFRCDDSLVGKTEADFIAKHGKNYVVVALGKDSDDIEFDVWYLKLDEGRIAKCFIQESEEW